MVGKKVRNETHRRRHRLDRRRGRHDGAAFSPILTIASSWPRRGHLAASSVRHSLEGSRQDQQPKPGSPAFAAELGGAPVTLSEGFARLDEADIVVFSTGADHYLLDGEAAVALSRRRGGRSLFIIDIAMPRNVAPEVAKAEGFYLYDMDDLKRVVQKSLAKREDDMARAATIVAAESSDCWERLTHPLPAYLAA